MKSQLLLRDRLYKTEDMKLGDKGVSATIRLNRGDEIFRGHFPDHPILPGVCTVQIIKELLSEAIAKELQLTRAINIKFLSFVDPSDNEYIDLDIQYAFGEENRITCIARVLAGQMAICSFKGEFVTRG